MKTWLVWYMCSIQGVDQVQELIWTQMSDRLILNKKFLSHLWGLEWEHCRETGHSFRKNGCSMNISIWWKLKKIQIFAHELLNDTKKSEC